MIALRPMRKWVARVFVSVSVPVRSGSRVMRN